MSNRTEAREDPKAQLFEELKDQNTIMLGVEGASDEMQPMTAFVDDTQTRLVVFTRKDSAIGRAGAGAAHFTLVGKQHDYHAFVTGRVTPIEDREILEELWNPVVSAWYPDGKNDPNLLMIEIVPARASIWASTGNPVVFGYQIAKANATGDEPDVGDHIRVEF